MEKVAAEVTAYWVWNPIDTPGVGFDLDGGPDRGGLCGFCALCKDTSAYGGTILHKV